MSKKSNGSSGIWSYIKRMIFGIVVGGLTLCIIIFGFVDNHNNSTPQSNRVERQAKNGVKKTFNQNKKPIGNYIKQRTNKDIPQQDRQKIQQKQKAQQKVKNGKQGGQTFSHKASKWLDKY